MSVTKKSRVDIALMAGVGVLLASLGYVIAGAFSEPRVVQAGDTAPRFTLTTAQGRRITPTDFGGRVLVLNFWATWCAPCVEEVPSLSELQKRTAGSGVVVVGVSVDRNPNLYTRFLKRFQPSFQTARDPDAKIPTSYGTWKFPETYIIDRNGVVVQKVISSRNWTDPDILNFVQSL